MVLTRAEKNRLLAIGVEQDSIDNMDNVPATSTVTIMTTAAPITSMVDAPAVIVAPEVIAPAVQQFMSMARTTGQASGPNTASATITSSDYSSLTAGQLRQGSSDPNVTPRREGAEGNPNTMESLREEFSRQMREFQRSLREIARTVGQQVEQAAAARNIPPPPASTSWQPLYGLGEFDRAPIPEREPQRAPIFGLSSSPYNPQPNHTDNAVGKIDLTKWGIKFDGSTKSMSAEDFIFRLNSLRQDYGYTYQDMLRGFHQLLEGQALDWYWNLRKLTPLHTWFER